MRGFVIKKKKEVNMVYGQCIRHIIFRHGNKVASTYTQCDIIMSLYSCKCIIL